MYYYNRKHELINCPQYLVPYFVNFNSVAIFFMYLLLIQFLLFPSVVKCLNILNYFFQMVSTVTIPGSERQFTFKGLLQRQHYEFWLVAHTIIGEGARSKVTSSSPMDEGFSLKTCSVESSDQVFYLFSPCKDYQLFLRHLLSTKPEHIPALSHGGKSSSATILGSQQQAGHQRGPVPGPQRWHPGREGHPREYE